MTRAKTADVGEVRLTRRDFTDVPLTKRMRSTKQLLLQLLKRRGAPIRGLITLAYDDRYTFTEWQDSVTGDYIIRWRKTI